ncbi:hypothetical protein QR680_010277 [Steinernema hermaphroditum]|uniref:Uncharacterized protein n=1 Tax=Steinernema hermaphroditum TaxID=289476 RepID=A0AA39IPT9_9BILA|nr:hypothetical protein QR680_010277 [Steinernema hermaphroditum]
MVEDMVHLEIPIPRPTRRRSRRKYKRIRCLCGRIKVKTATIYVAVLILLITVCDFIHTVRVDIQEYNVKGFWTSFSILLDITWFISSLCAIEAVASEDPDFLFPFLIMNIIISIIMPIVFAASFSMLLFPDSWLSIVFFDREDARPAAMDACFYRTIFSFFLIPVTIGFSYFIRQSYKNFKQFRRRRS